MIEDQHSERAALSEEQRGILDALEWLAAKGITAPNRKMLSAITSYSGVHYTKNLGALHTAGLICYQPEARTVGLTTEGRLLSISLNT